MTSISALVSLLLLVSIAAPAAKRTITHEDVFTMARTSRPVVSPDGKWIAYNVAEPNYDPAKAASDLWVVSPDGGAKPRRLTNTRETEGGATWSPDSRWIAFTAKREGDQAEQDRSEPVPLRGELEDAGAHHAGRAGFPRPAEREHHDLQAAATARRARAARHVSGRGALDSQGGEQPPPPGRDPVLAGAVPGAKLKAEN